MLIQLHESTDPITPEAIDAFSLITAGWYAARYDCVMYIGSSPSGGFYKLYRDGTLIRVCRAADYLYGFSIDDDRPFSFGLGEPTFLHDPVGMKRNPATPGPITYTGLVASGHSRPLVYRGFYYTVASTAVFSKRDLATGSVVTDYTTTGSITPFQADRLDITSDGIAVVIDADNGTYGVVRFFDMNTNTNLYTSVFPRAVMVFVDRVNKNIWSVNLSDSKLCVFSFDVAPYQFSPFTVGANRSRYRQDAISATLLGAQGEPVRFWPVGWRLTQPVVGGGFLGDFEVGYGALGSHGGLVTSAEGHLEHDYTETDEDGVTENLYCGPGTEDYVGQPATIEAWTGY